MDTNGEKRSQTVKKWLKRLKMVKNGSKWLKLIKWLKTVKNS